MKYILYARTDSPQATLALTTSGVTEPIERSWHAGRELSKDLLCEIESLVKQGGISLQELGGLVVYAGPGSFTGLRISVTVFNALADSLSIPVVGVGGDEWMSHGKDRLESGDNDVIVAVEYGGEANITLPRK